MGGKFLITSEKEKALRDAMQRDPLEAEMLFVRLQHEIPPPQINIVENQQNEEEQEEEGRLVAVFQVRPNPNANNNEETIQVDNSEGPETLQ